MGTASLTCSIAAFAHDGPEHEIEELTERLMKEGESADLLLQRAIEFKVLGKFTEAAKDLERSLQLDSSSALAQRELSRTYFALGKTNEALSAVTRSLDRQSQPADHAALLVVRAEILRPRGEHARALEDVNEAIEEYPSSVEWYLLRSQIQARLKLKSERVKGLQAGMAETGSGLLEIEWIDALIDDGQHERAMETIESELKASRWKSSWFIRRAKVHLASGNSAKGKADLEAAIEELKKRINTASPDPLLIADRGLARDLLGDRDAARKDYEAARNKGVTDEWLRERLAALSRKPKNDVPAEAHEKASETNQP